MKFSLKLAALVSLVLLAAAFLGDPAVIKAQRKLEYKIGDWLIACYR